MAGSLLIVITKIIKPGSWLKSCDNTQQQPTQTVDIFRQQFASKLERLLQLHTGTFDDTIDVLQAMGDNCTRAVTGGMLELQAAVKLHDQLAALNAHLSGVSNGFVDGHAGLFPGQQALYVLLSHQPWVRQVCEIGFNAGHSALFWLVGSNTTKLLTFDIAILSYTRPMGEYMVKSFPGRVETVWGDSLQVVTPFLANKMAAEPDFSCDVIVIDGNHNHDFVLRDLRNMRPAANKRRHLIITDDYPCKTCSDVGSAFVDARNEQLIGRFTSCTAYPDTTRGMAFAYYYDN
jgi:hypothetical protein